MEDVQLIVPVTNLTTVLSAAEYLNVHFTTLYRWLQKGKTKAGIPLHPITIAGTVYLIKDEMESIKKAMEESKNGE